jgi:pimeloyl-ACP methyl ester carboxylesterase
VVSASLGLRARSFRRAKEGALNSERTLGKRERLLYDRDERYSKGLSRMSAAVRRNLPLADGAVSYLEWEGPRGAPLLVFLHANGFNAETYVSILGPLAGQFRILAPDLRGHGSTTLRADPREGNWTIFRDDLIAFVDKLGLRPTVLAGHSMGATASLLAAGMRPDMAEALVLSEPVLQPDKLVAYSAYARATGQADKLMMRVASTKRRRAHFASHEEAFKSYLGRGAFRTWPESMIADYLRGGLIARGDGFELACAPAWEARLYSIFPFGLARLGSSVRVPVTMLLASEQSSANADVVAGFARRNGRTRLLTLPGTTHFLPMEKPEILHREILGALDETFPAAAPLSSPLVE